MAVFNPIDVMGPAHRPNQTLQQLAQGAAQNVMRRQRMRALLAGSARSAAGPGMGQPFRSSLNGRPGGVKSSVLMRMLGGQGNGGGVGNGHGNDGVFGNGGGGFDYPSIPAPTDPAQSMQTTAPNTVAQVPSAPSAPSPTQPAPTPLGGTVGPVQQLNLTPQALSQDVNTMQLSGGFDSSPSTDMVHLGGGVFYDPVTDTVARHPGQQG
jgi:hypothetical protein